MSKTTVAIIDYGSGNLRSAAKAFEKIATDHRLDVAVNITDKPDGLSHADYIVLPGQGAFGDCMGGLSALDGMIDALEENVLHKGKPFLGICVGMQLLANEGLEGGTYKGLGWIDGQVRAIVPRDPSLKIPHMGWNTLNLTPSGENHPALSGITGETHFYYVHSYQFDCANSAHILGTVEYGDNITSVVGRDNIIGVQFHPEKSHDAGLALIGRFLAWKP